MVKIHEVHPLPVEREKFEEIQNFYANKICLENPQIDKKITYCAGVDAAYWEQEGVEWGICSIVVIDYKTKELVEKTFSAGKITVPYLPGYLAFRELPLVVEAAKKLVTTPDLFLFDGNGYLHPRHMGIATHASFFLNKPTIGVAKSYLKINKIDYKMPGNEIGANENIIIGSEVFGKVLRTRKNVKPIFISCGNKIDLQTTTDIVLNLLNDESRLPIPVRMADLETKRLRRENIVQAH